MARTQPDPSAQAVEIIDPQMAVQTVATPDPQTPAEFAPTTEVAPQGTVEQVAVEQPVTVQPREDRPIVHGSRTYTEVDARLLGLTWP